MAVKKITLNGYASLGTNVLTDNELLIIEPLLTQAVQDASGERPAPAWFPALCDLQEKVQMLIDNKIGRAYR